MRIKSESSLLKNITRVLSANFLVAVIGFVGSFIFPKILTIESYALYHTFTLYIGYIGVLHLGFPSGMAINYAGKHYEDIDKQQYKSELKLLLIILIFFTLCFLGIYISTRDKMILYVTLEIIPICLISTYKALFQAWSQFKKYTKITTIIAISIPLMALLYYTIKKSLPGEIYIKIYLLVNWIVAFFLIVTDIKNIYSVKNRKLLSLENWKTEKIGLALMLGNYVNTLFVSVDKQFIKIFFSTKEFAFYSFGMSMQALMTVFITSIAQPLFPAMAQGKFKDKDYDNVKRLLLVFGSFSGCAYFVTSIIVKIFIKKYIGSLQIVGIYFVVFPAMAVINCLYINLYKIKGLMKNYIVTLIGILLTSIILNYILIHIIRDFTAVAIATTLTYYIWFFIGFRQFKFLKITFKDMLFLLIYTINFFVITCCMNDYLGFITYFIFICILAMVFYKKELTEYIKKK